MSKTLMVQGTASGVGKSTLVMGLCRLFAQDGLRVAPFKVQNLSSNAFRFPDGREMALSQALAAQACRVEPEPDMNPVLLKPGGRNSLEVLLNGEPLGRLEEYDYAALKRRLREEAYDAYERLSKQYDVIVAEGAGSPAELNLKQDDMVNMGFARKAGCPVLLAADISRGGVFASVFGTLALLEPEERALVKGIVINRFDGLPGSFKAGAVLLEQHAGKPVLGIVPHIPLELEDEDLPTHGAEMKTAQGIANSLPPGKSLWEHREEQFDRLAAVLRKTLNLTGITGLLK